MNYSVTIWADYVDGCPLFEKSFETFSVANNYASSFYYGSHKASTIWKHGCRIMDIG